MSPTVNGGSDRVAGALARDLTADGKPEPLRVAAVYDRRASAGIEDPERLPAIDGNRQEYVVLFEPERHIGVVAARGEDEIARFVRRGLEHHGVDFHVGLEQGRDGCLLLSHRQDHHVLSERVEDPVDVAVVGVNGVLLVVGPVLFRLPQKEVGCVHVPDPLDSVRRAGHTEDVAVGPVDLLNAVENHREDVGRGIEVLEQREPPGDVPPGQRTRILFHA